MSTVPMKSPDDTKYSIILGTDQLAIDSRVATFDAAADMPTDAGNVTLVTADLWTNTTFTSTARRIVAKWHEGSTTYTATAGAGPIAVGARITINADDAATAATRLAIVNQTGGNTTTSGKVDTFILTKANPVIDITTSAAITRIDAIGLPKAGAAPTTIMPSYLEIQVLG